MHKGVILLVKAPNPEYAKRKVQEFMDGYYNDVWDWYVVGGRWSGTLSEEMLDEEKRNIFWEQFRELRLGWTNLENPVTDQRNRAHNLFKSIFPEWNEEEVPIPVYRDSYNSEGEVDDVMVLGNCLPVVESWLEAWYNKREQCLNCLIEEAVTTHEISDMALFRMKDYINLGWPHFNFSCNVYNITDYAMSIPEDPTGWYAVMVDMHN